mgnify:CR=1 FL=1
MNKESEKQVREPRAPYATTAETAIEERVLEQQMTTVSPLSPRVQQAVQIIQEFKNQERDQFLHLLPNLLSISPEEYGWLKMAESAFEFWDNEEDAIYDRL